jgi:hypothetical protein
VAGRADFRQTDVVCRFVRGIRERAEAVPGAPSLENFANSVLPFRTSLVRAGRAQENTCSRFHRAGAGGNWRLTAEDAAPHYDGTDVAQPGGARSHAVK